MNLPFANRPPNARELERLRLILSTYQDGSGMLTTSNTTLPGWRDFERACALAFNGNAVESKFFVDVIFPFTSEPHGFYGVDCKMRRELKSVESKGIIYIEVTNASKLLWNYLYAKGVTLANYRNEPELAGNSLIEAVEQLKKEGSSTYPSGLIDLNHSYYFVLLWEKEGNYQLFQVPLALLDPGNLQWICYVSSRPQGGETTRLVGKDGHRVLYEWYGESGGQLKYYPPVDFAVWKSERFRLESLPQNVDQGVVAKAKVYFADLWKDVDE